MTDFDKEPGIIKDEHLPKTFPYVMMGLFVLMCVGSLAVPVVNGIASLF